MSFRVIDPTDWDKIRAKLTAKYDAKIAAAAIEVESRAKTRIGRGNPQGAKDTGGLANRIAAKRLRPGAWKVSANARHAAFMEFGTGPYGRQTQAGLSVPSWYRHSSGKMRGPSTRHLERWAKRVGVDPGAAARVIREGKNGRPPGLRARPYLRPSFLEVRKKMRSPDFWR